jgi:hypothetical protein
MILTSDQRSADLVSGNRSAAALTCTAGKAPSATSLLASTSALSNSGCPSPHTCAATGTAYGTSMVQMHLYNLACASVWQGSAQLACS